MAKTTLQYKLPSREDEDLAIKKMHPDQVGKLRDEIKFRLEGLLRSCDDYFDNLIESHCDLCSKTGYGYFDLPNDWGWKSGTGYLLCDECIKRWTKRFGAPETNREGEIVYEYGSVSKDTTFGRQTNFEFI